MMPEFTVQVMKIEASGRQPRPVKYVPPKLRETPMSVPNRQGSVKRSTPKSSKVIEAKSEIPSEHKSIRKESIEEYEEVIQKQFIDMDPRYLYYQEINKQQQNMIEIMEGVMFYKPIKAEEMPKPPKPPKKKKLKNQQTSVPQQQQEQADEDQQEDVKEVNQSIDNNNQRQSYDIDPAYLIQGQVEGYEQSDDSQSQLFSYGLNDYVDQNVNKYPIQNHLNDIGDKDVEEEVKPRLEGGYSYQDYYPNDGSIPKPLLESVNYMNWLKQQQELQQQQQQEAK